MTPEAQSALRRIIETYSKVTRFCLICNYVTRVIEPLASRCAKFRFKPLPVISMKNRMIYIAEREHVNLGPDTLDTIMKSSNGDMRKAVTFLQSAHQLSNGQVVITPDMVTDIAGQVPSSIMTALWVKMAGNSFDAMKAEVTEIVYQGFPMSAILSQLHDDCIHKAELSDLDKALICEKIAEADQCLVDGSCESIQLLDVAAFVMRRLTMFTAVVDGLGASNH
eukprot:gene36548-45069_t